MKTIRTLLAIPALSILCGCVAVPVERGYYDEPQGYYAPGYYYGPGYYGPSVGVEIQGGHGWHEGGHEGHEGGHDWHGGHRDRD